MLISKKIVGVALVSVVIPSSIVLLGACEQVKQREMKAEFVDVATDMNSSGVILKSDKPVLVDFYSKTGGFCDQVSAIVDEMAKKYNGRMKFVRVNADENPSLVKTYQVDSFPTLRVFSQKNKVIMPLIGLRDKAQVEDYIKKALLTLDQ